MVLGAASEQRDPCGLVAKGDCLGIRGPRKGVGWDALELQGVGDFVRDRLSKFNVPVDVSDGKPVSVGAETQLGGGDVGGESL